MEPYEVRVARAERELEKILPSPEFVRGLDPRIMADIVSKARQTVEKYNVRAEDILVDPHPGDIFLDWLRHVFYPQSVDHIDPEGYLEAVHAFYNTMLPLLRENHRKEFKRIIAEHLAYNPTAFATDADHYWKVLDLAKKYPVVDRDHLLRTVFYLHRDAARDHAMNGNFGAALEHLGFLADLLDRERIEHLDRERPMEFGVAPKTLRFEDLARWVLREAERLNLHCHPGYQRHYGALRRVMQR